IALCNTCKSNDDNSAPTGRGERGQEIRDEGAARNIDAKGRCDRVVSPVRDPLDDRFVEPMAAEAKRQETMFGMARARDIPEMHGFELSQGRDVEAEAKEAPELRHSAFEADHAAQAVTNRARHRSRKSGMRA